jgi:hypothetical protein
MFRILLILVTVLITSAVSAAPLKPQVPPEERVIYMDMLQTNPTAAKANLITREYLSVCRQVVANPKLASDLPDQTDGVDYRYLTSADRKVVKDAI